MIHSFEGMEPKVEGCAFIAWNAEVVGSVELDGETSVWYSASIRGDIDTIRIGWGSNIQDNAALHVDEGIPLTVGRDVTIGHGAVVHGCTIGDGTLIGMGAIVLNGARIGRESIVGAGALVTEGKEFPDRSLIVGSPAKAVRSVTEDEVSKIRRNAASYRDRARLHAKIGSAS
jgi:carbonic anhydrase/acetyltransferase-like protein (isoleucine patch superfamily)